MSRILTLAAVAALMSASAGGFTEEVPTLHQQLEGQRGRGRRPRKSQKKRRKERRRRGA